jgi:hypothetical protein
MTNATAGNATLLTTYVMTNQLTITQGNWIKVGGMTNILAANGIYAFSINRTGSGWWTPAADNTQPYANGRSGNYPTAAVGVPSFNNYDLAFDVNLTAITDPLVGDTVVSPNSLFAGPTVTLSATFSGTAPFTTFDWQSDGGTGGVTWTSLSGSTTNTYSVNTTGFAAGTYQYRLAVTGAAGTITNTAGSLVILPPTPPIVATQTAISTPSTFAGNVVTMSASFTGLAPISYQWQFSDLATFTNNISGATNNTYQISDAAVANSGSYRLRATNSLGSSNSAFAALTVTNPSVVVQILNISNTVPVASGFDIAQLSTAGNVGNPSGLNYYSDNGAGAEPGQTFTTGSNPDGYLLSSLYILWGSINGSHAAANPYTLNIYSVSGTTATILQTYTNQNSAVAMATGQWTKWIGLSNILAPNATYAYSIRARSPSGTGSGFMQVGNASANPYSGGSVGLFPEAGGTINYGADTNEDATFLVHLGNPPPTPVNIQAVNISPANSTTNPVYVGTPVTLSVTAIGSSPKTYQWYSDNGSGGATFTAISGATSNPYVLDTSSLTPGTQYQYQVAVTNTLGGSVSSSAVLNMTNASGPILVSGTTYTASAVNVPGSSVTMTATFIGSQPITYQWQANTGTGFTNIPGATANSYTIPSVQFSDAGKYTLVASSTPPGIGAISANSTSNILYVVPVPQTNSSSAKISDGGTSPIVGAYDVSQLVDAAAAVPGVNYYVDAGRPPGEIFTTGSSAPSGFGGGLPLNYVYVKHDSTGTGTGYATAQSYTLYVYKMLDSSNAQLVTTYVTTNTTTFAAGDWVRFDGLTNVLAVNSQYAFAVNRNTSGYWKLAANVGASPNPGGQAAVFSTTGGKATLTSPDAVLGYYYDAAFVAGMTPATAPVELAVMTINPSSIHILQGPVVMTASFSGSLPITYQWQHAGTNLPGATSTTYTIPIATVAAGGTYACLASNQYSFGTPTSSTPQTLTVDPTVQTGLINATTRNGSFELISGVAGTGKRNISTGTVDNWTTWPAFSNSGDTGTDTSANSTDGTRDAFLQGDSGIYNMAGQYIQAGDTYIYSWDWVLNGRGSAVAQLGYWDGTNVVLISGTDTTAPGGNTGKLLGLGTNYTVLAGNPAIGHPVVLTVNAPAGQNYPEVDNFVLNVFPAGSIASNPTNITYSVSGGAVALSWPADHLGWILQGQTNGVSVGVSNNWADVPGTALVTSKSIGLNTNAVGVFFRLRHP